VVDRDMEAWFDDLCNNLETKLHAVIKYLTSKGEFIAMNEVGHIDTGETLTSISSSVDGLDGEVIAGGNAIWLEFGTGVTRNATPHPEPVESEIPIYAWGTYGKGNAKNPKGWFYPTTNPDEAVYYNEKTGVMYAHTYGIPANFFMYNTGREIATLVPTALHEVFNK